MKFLKFLLFALTILPAASSLAATGDVAAGKEKAQACAGCHGEKGISAIPGIPSLAGQQDQFIQWQIVFFRSGRRPNPVMAPIVAEISDADLRNLGAYFASLPYPPSTATPDPDLFTKGKEVAVTHHCANCHTDSFRGSRAAAAIANQREDYLVKALTDYRSAARPSTAVAAMNEAAGALSDDEITAVSHYLAAFDAPHP